MEKIVPDRPKHRGNEINCRKNWNEKRMIIMYDILRCKFTDGTISDHNTSRKYPIRTESMRTD